MAKVTKFVAPLHVVFVDTNILWFEEKGPAVNPDFDAFWAEHNTMLRMELVVPEVVRDELLFQHCMSGQKLIEKASECLTKLSSITTMQHRHRLSNEGMKKHIRAKFDRWLEQKEATVEPIPLSVIDWRELCRRAAWRLPPFALDAKNPELEKGFRDNLIFETVLHRVTKEARGAKIVFICNDSILRNALVERLKDRRDFLAVESLADFSSYIKLTLKELEQQFIGKIVRRARERFFTSGDSQCLWVRESLASKIPTLFPDAMTLAEESLRQAVSQLPQSRSLMGGGEKTSLFDFLVTKSSPRWEPYPRFRYFVGPHEYQRTSGKRTYHWRSATVAVRKYLLVGEDGKILEENFHFAFFKVNWKADVKADARFYNIALEDIVFDRKEFRRPTSEEIKSYNLDEATKTT